LKTHLTIDLVGVLEFENLLDKSTSILKSARLSTQYLSFSKTKKNSIFEFMIKPLSHLLKTLMNRTDLKDLHI